MPPRSARQLTLLSYAIDLASPKPGSPMSSLVEEHARPIREWTADQASECSSLRPEAFHFTFAPRLSNLGFTMDEEPELRQAWANTAQWLVAYAVGAVKREDSLRDAQQWFLGNDTTLATAGDKPFAQHVRIPPPTEVWALLPYLLDPLAPGTRRSVAEDDRQQNARLARKERGVFYTPSDLAEYMIMQIDSDIRDTWLDPACGTGVFLRIPLARSAPVGTVFGCDISQLALEMCAFVLLACLDQRAVGPRPWATWHMIRSNLACVNTLQLFPGSDISPIDRQAQKAAVNDLLQKGVVPAPTEDHMAFTHLGDIFPELVGGADAVVMNPPYAALGKDAESLRSRFETLATAGSQSTNAFVPFIEQGLRLMDQNNGRFCAVVPLSIATGSQRDIRKLRSIIEHDVKGTRRFRFFDRAPDALFGDDVKTRNTVINVDSNGPELIATTSLHRWTSSRRHDVFLRAAHTTPIATPIERLVPKIGSPAESKIYSQLRDKRMDVLASAIKSHRTTRIVDHDLATHNDEPELLVAPTAYNWFNSLKATSPALDMGFDSTVGYHHLEFNDPEDAWAAYAIVSSRLMLWLWRIEADAFHVSRTFLLEIPLTTPALQQHRKAELADLGRGLWKEAVANPSISVNKGRTTVGFRVEPESYLLDDVDGVVTDMLGIHEEFDLKKWHTQLVDVERNRTNR